MPNVATDPLLVWLAVCGVAMVLAHAAVTHLSDRLRFEGHLLAYRVPAGLSGALAWALPLAEALAVLALVAIDRRAGALGAAALLALYGGAMAWQLAQGRRPRCGCGGDELPVSGWLVLRNALLVALALLAAQPVTRDMGWGDRAVVAAGLLLGLALYAAAHQLLRHPVPRASSSSTTPWRS